ncbi:MAG: FUSC family protein [Negativicutes bacterium]|jgi:uncharacterized membrane protein YccC
MKLDRRDLNTLIKLSIWLVPAIGIICAGHIPQGMLYALGGMAASGMDQVAGTRSKLKWFSATLILMLLLIALITLAVPYSWSQFIVLPGVCFLIAFLSVGGINGTQLGQVGLLTLLNCYLTLTVNNPSIYVWLVMAGWFFCGALLTLTIYLMLSFLEPGRTLRFVFADMLLLMAKLCQMKLNYLNDDKQPNMHATFALVRQLHTIRLELAGLLENSADRRAKILFVCCTRLSDHLSALFYARGKKANIAPADVEYIRTALARIEQFFLQQRELFFKKQTGLAEIKPVAKIVSADAGRKGSSESEEVTTIEAALVELDKLAEGWNSAHSDLTVVAFTEPLIVRLKTNLDWHSEIMHHAVKLAVTALLALSVGWFCHMERYYYIILMALLMVKPFAAGTWQMFRWRLISTLLALTLAFGYLQLQPGTLISGIAVVFSLAAARVYLRRNYLVFNMALTFALSIFVCAFMQTDIHWLIRIRVEDTAIGMALALVVTLGVFPRWEAVYIKHDLAKAWREQARLIRFYSINGSIDARERKLSLRYLDAVYDSWRRMLDEPAGQRRNYSSFAKTIYATVMIVRLTFSLTVTDYREHAARQDMEMCLEQISRRLENAADLETGVDPGVISRPIPEYAGGVVITIPSIEYLDNYSRVIWNNVCKYRQINNGH